MAEGEPRVVMIAVDGSDHANDAFSWYMDNMARESDDVKVVHCSEFAIDFAFGKNYNDEKSIQEITSKMKQHQDECDKLKDKFIDQLRGKAGKNKQVKGEAFILNGKKPGEEIVRASKEHKANLLICGTRGQGTIRRTIMGSVSDYIVHHAECPVVVVRLK